MSVSALPYCYRGLTCSSLNFWLWLTLKGPGLPTCKRLTTPEESFLLKDQSLWLTFTALVTCLTSWTLGPAHLGYHLDLLLCGSADFPGLISLLAWTVYRPDPSSKAGLWSFLGSRVLQSSQENTGKEDHTLGGCRPSCSASVMSNIRPESPPFHSSPFSLHVSPTTRTFPRELIRVQGDRKSQEFCLWTYLQTIEFVSPTLCKDGTRRVGEKRWIRWGICPQAAENLKGVEITDFHFFQ